MQKNTPLAWLIVGLLALTVSPATAQFRISEDFTTTTNRDAAATTADWNTSEGQLKLFPFQITNLASLDTPGFCRSTFLDGHYLYLADGYSGLQIINVSDAANPSLVGNANTSGYSYQVQVSGNYAYVADHSGGLQIVDVTDPTNPTIVGNAPTANDALGLAVAVDLVIVGAGTALEFFDISNPLAPVLLHSLQDTAAAFRQIHISGRLAYVASGDMGLVVYDFSDPSNPSEVGRYDTPGYAYRVVAAGDVAYVLDQGNGMMVFDISDPTKPMPWLTMPEPGSTRGLEIDGDKLYWAIETLGVQVVDISTPTNPTILYTHDTAGHAYDVAVAGEYAYVAVYGSGLEVLKIADLMSPLLTGAVATSGRASGVFVDGNYAYVADGTAGLKVVDVTDRFAPVLVGTAASNGAANAVAVSGNWAFLACSGTYGLQVIDVSDPRSPAMSAWVYTSGDAENLFIEGNSLYLAAGAGGLQVYDIASETGAYLVSPQSSASQATDVFVSGNFAYVADGSAGMRVFDISDPTTLTQVGAYSSPSPIYCVSVEGDVAVVGTGIGIEVIDVSNPAAPAQLGLYYSGDAEIKDIVLMGNKVFATVDYLGTLVLDISDLNNISINGHSYTNGTANGICRAGELIYLTADLAGSSGTTGLEILQAFQGDVDTAGDVGQSQLMTFEQYPLLRYRFVPTGSGHRGFILVNEFGGSVIPGAIQGWTKNENPGNSLSWRTRLEWRPEGTGISNLVLEWLSDSALIQSVSDVPDDQGGQVRLQWMRSGHDFIGDETQIVEYAVYRQFDLAAAGADKAHGGADYSGQSSLVQENARLMQDTGWDFVTSVPVLVRDNYSVVVPSLADSTIAGGQNFSTFQVIALTATPGVFFSSPADSGYSVDNKEPGVPTSIMAGYQAGSVDLDWDDAPEEDFQYFRIYRDTQEGFVPAPENLVHQVSVSAWTDPVNDPWQYTYQITAVDYAGNESDAGVVATASGVPGAGVANAFALRGAVPNPFNPQTTIAFELPRQETVSLRVFDIAGHLVRTLVGGEVIGEGRHERVWLGRDDSGRALSSGTYFYRLEAGEYSETKRMALIK